MLSLTPGTKSKGLSPRMTDGEMHESMVPIRVIRNKALVRPVQKRRVPRSSGSRRKPCQISGGTTNKTQKARSIACGNLANTRATVFVNSISGTYLRLGADLSLGVRRLTRLSYSKHLRKHIRPVLCPSCDERQPFQRDMRRHVVTAHTALASRLGITPPYMACRYCGMQILNRKDNLVRHEQTCSHRH